jgi:hypothetical protein
MSVKRKSKTSGSKAPSGGARTPARSNTAPKRRPHRRSALTPAQVLADKCHEAYVAHPKSCSHSAIYVIRALVDPKFPQLVANDLVDHLDKNWKRIKLDDGWSAATKGKVAIAGRKEAGHGHVCVFYPGPRKTAGGYSGWPPTTEVYPLAMSTSLGTWAGAISDGDKTVFDPWFKRSTFEEVKFWATEVPRAKAK